MAGGHGWLMRELEHRQQEKQSQNDLAQTPFGSSQVRRACGRSLHAAHSSLGGINLRYPYRALPYKSHKKMGPFPCDCVKAAITQVVGPGIGGVPGGPSPSMYGFTNSHDSWPLRRSAGMLSAFAGHWAAWMQA
jgi:hypothetical protein